MKRLLATTALALCLGATATQAEMQPVAGAGYWTSLVGTSDRNVPMCEIQTHGKTFNFMLKYLQGNLFINLWHDGWNIPEGVTARVNMWVDNAPGWWIDMSGTRMNDLLSGEVNPNVLRTGSSQPILDYILDMLRTGNTLRIAFPQGNTDPWVLSLEGTRTVMASFGQCILQDASSHQGQPYGGNAGQPYGGQNTGQPYGNPPRQMPPTQKTTQPYTPL